MFAKPDKRSVFILLTLLLKKLPGITQRLLNEIDCKNVRLK